MTDRPPDSKRVASAKATRRRKAVEAFASVRECVGDLEPDMSIFAVTRGQFSMIDVVNECIRQTGPCFVSVWTWAIADYEVDVFTALLERQEILGGRLVVDYSAEGRNADLIQQWRNRFGVDQVRVCKNHAKIARVWTEPAAHLCTATDAAKPIEAPCCDAGRPWRILARGSMNLNFNPRFEQFDLTEGGADFDLVEQIEDELPVLPAGANRRAAEEATRLGQAFERSTLEMFRGTRVWAK